MGRCSILVPSPTAEQYFRLPGAGRAEMDSVLARAREALLGPEVAAALAHGQWLGGQELLAWLGAEHVLPPLESLNGGRMMSNSTVGDAAIAVVRRNTEEVQGKGNWDLFEKLFSDDFVDHTPQPGTTPDKNGVRVLYKRLRAAFPDFRPEIHWQVAAGDLVTTYKTYHGTHQSEFLGIPATGKKVSFYTVDAMRVVDGKITEHWGVATLLDLMQQLGVVPRLGGQR